MIAAAHEPGSLGPATERRLAAAFAEGAFITANACAALLGLDVKTLRAMTDALAIRAVQVGKQRRYTEADIRAYLSDPPAAEPQCPSTKRRKAATGSTISSGRVVAFTALPVSKPAARPRR